MAETDRFFIREAGWIAGAAALTAVRRGVFIREQGIPADLEWDDRDGHAFHMLAQTPNGHAIGTGRMLADGRIGRMAVLAGWRGRGVGTALLGHLLGLARRRGLTRVTLAAQLSAVGFYRARGFAAQR